MPSLLPLASSTSRRSRQRLETRERLYTAALAEFREVGFVAASVERIVAATGVARGTFYFHFPTKDHVLLELQRRHESAIVKRLALLPDSVSIVALLRAVVEAVLAEQERIGDTRLFRDLLAVYLRRPEGVDLGDPAFPLVQALAERFLAAADRGAVRDDVSPPGLAVTLLSTVYGFLSSADADPDTRRASFEPVIAVFVRGVSP